MYDHIVAMLLAVAAGLLFAKEYLGIEIAPTFNITEVVSQIQGIWTDNLKIMVKKEVIFEGTVIDLSRWFIRRNSEWVFTMLVVMIFYLIMRLAPEYSLPPPTQLEYLY